MTDIQGQWKSWTLQVSDSVVAANPKKVRSRNAKNLKR